MTRLTHRVVQHLSAGLLVCMLWLCFGSLSVFAAEPAHLRLVDRLDRPVDGYCIDVHGTASNLRTDLPLFAHNCKSRLTADSAVVFADSGEIEFIDPGLCVTVAGVNSAALPGAAVILRQCGESGAFFEATALQRFIQHSDGRLELKGSGLCLVAGRRSGVTYSSSDRWRSLFVDDCASVNAALSQWEFIVPG